jgi:hypothetical protein
MDILNDSLFIAATVGLTALVCGLAQACERLGGRP